MTSLTTVSWLSIMWCFMHYHVMRELCLSPASEYVTEITSSLYSKKKGLSWCTPKHIPIPTRPPWLESGAYYFISNNMTKRSFSEKDTSQIKLHKLNNTRSLQIVFIAHILQLTDVSGWKWKGAHMGNFLGHHHFPYLLKLLRKHAPLCAPCQG